jgi:WD40 repeat protein
VSVDFSPDGTKVATRSEDNTAWLWDVATAKPLGEPLRHEGSVTAVAFSPDGTKLATASRDTTARLWDIDVALQESADHLLTWASAITGLEFDASGVVKALSQEELADCHAQLDRAGGPPKAYVTALKRLRTAQPPTPRPPEP